jgi:hypothetical protein
LITGGGNTVTGGILFFYKGEELLIYYWETIGEPTEATKYEGIRKGHYGH